MLLACAANDVQNIRKRTFFLKKILKMCHKANFKCLVFRFNSARLIFVSSPNSIKKTALKTLIFIKKFIFCIFEPQNPDVKESYSKALLNFISLECTYFGKASFQ